MSSRFSINILGDKNDAGVLHSQPTLESRRHPIHQAMTVRTKNKKSTVKSSYRHVPHSQKPPQVVARRNARERRRVQAVNSAFLKLRKHVPYHSKHKRLSKVKTLKIAIDYIHELQSLISDFDSKTMESKYNNNYQGTFPNQNGNNVLPNGQTPFHPVVPRRRIWEDRNSNLQVAFFLLLICNLPISFLLLIYRMLPS